MIPTHATKAGVRYRYYVSTPVLHGEAKTASAGSVSRVPAGDIEDTVVKSLKEHLAPNQGKSATGTLPLGDRGDLAQLVAGIVVHRDRLIIRFKSDNADQASNSPEDRLLSIPWRKPPSKKSRQMLLPHHASRSDVRPEQFERRARLVSAIARGRRWLDDVVSGRVTTVAELCAREKCSVRHVNMTISLAFLAPNLIKAAVEGRLPRGIGIERLRDQVVFAQGDAADTVFYIQKGQVKVVVISEQGKEAVVGIFGPGQFFGEGCMNGHSVRIATTTAMEDCLVTAITKAAMLAVLHDQPKFSEMFMAYLLTRNSRIEEDLIDQHSSEKRLARLLLLLANFGKEGSPQPIIPNISQETLAEMIGTTRSRVSFFMNKFRKLGLISYNGKIEVNSSLLNAVLYDKPEIKREP